MKRAYGTWDAWYIGQWFVTLHVRRAFLIGAWVMSVSWGINLGPFEVLATPREGR